MDAKVKIEYKEVRGYGIFKLNDMGKEGWKPHSLVLDNSSFRTWSGLLYREVRIDGFQK